MLNIVCVKHGTRYTAEHVNILYDMVQRNLSSEFEGRFICFTDDPSGLDSRIAFTIIPDCLDGWWAKLWLFHDDHFPHGDRVLYFDLDTVIMGSLDEIAAYDGPFAILKEFGSVEGFNSSVMAWPANTVHDIWTDWHFLGRPHVDGGDQVWIHSCRPEAEILQDEYPGLIKSYKVECQPYPSRGTGIVCFHGNPKPWEATDEWVRRTYCIGGLSAGEVQTFCNVQNERLFDNISQNCRKARRFLTEWPESTKEAVIVGGAPSSAFYLPHIEYRSNAGQTLFALNGAALWLNEHDIIPDYLVVLDARESNLKFLDGDAFETLLASQCDPSLFDKRENAILWHSEIPEMRERLPRERKDDILVNGGSSILTRAMTIAYALGHRTISIYGADSSFGETHHAYAQPENDKDKRVTAFVGGREFVTTPWMAAQVNEFQLVTAELVNNLGCEIKVFGDGLLPHVAAMMARAARAA